MKQLSWIIIIGLGLASCQSETKTNFEVTGKITHTTGKMVYLEEVPVGSMQPTIVDSAVLKQGQFSLKAQTSEAAIYNIRIDQLDYPVASVINDQPKVEIDITMSVENNQFPEKYEVKHSPASLKMKDFMLGFNNKMMAIYNQARQLDSLQTIKAPDSVLAPFMRTIKQEGLQLKEYALSEINQAENPALALFELGYYQSTANGQGMGLPPLDKDQVLGIIDGVLKKYPTHSGIVTLQQNLQKQMTAAAEKSWIGKMAPDFTLPDPSGKTLSLSSFKGQYVLVDFWASWCKPCRMENPHLVAAYQKFKDKGFTILGVSLDKEKQAWEAAIKQDKLTWPHVSDLKFWESSVVPLYRFEGIPFNVLVDPQGKIIAEGLRGLDLEAKLASLFH